MGSSLEPNNTSKKVLVAIRPKDHQKIANVLGAEFNTIFCYTLEEARSQLDEHTGLVICGAYFDDGRMFDLLRHAKENARTRSIPFCVIFGSEREYSAAILHGIQKAAEILGANAIIDVFTLKKELGKAQAYESLRQSVRRILSSDGL